MNERSDDELVAGFQDGDETCFNELVYRYKNMLYQYIKAMVRDESAAEDIFQEVFLSFYRNMKQYRPQGKFKNYLFTSARNRVLNFFRDKKEMFSLDDTDENGNPYLHEQLESGEAQPLETMEQAELGRRIRQASLRLSVKQREILYLKQYMTFQEAAQLLQRPLGSLLADHHRAVQKMQKLLREEA